MENNLKNFDDLFREEFSDYSEVPSPAVWQALEQRLDNSKKRRVFPFRWYWFISILSFITLLGASVAWNIARNAATAVVPETNTGKMPVSLNAAANAIAGHSVNSPSLKPAHKNNSANRTNQKRHTEHHNIASNQKDNSAHKAIKTGNAGNTSGKGNASGSEELRKHNASMTSTEGNAPATGTSIYSYDDFENDEVADSKPQTAATSYQANTDNEYVVKKARKHNMIVAQEAPVPEQTNGVVHEKRANEEEAIAATIYRESIDIDASSRQVAQEKNDIEYVAADKADSRGSRAAKKVRKTAIPENTSGTTAVATTSATTKQPVIRKNKAGMNNATAMEIAAQNKPAVAVKAKKQSSSISESKAPTKSEPVLATAVVPQEPAKPIHQTPSDIAATTSKTTGADKKAVKKLLAERTVSKSAHVSKSRNPAGPAEKPNAGKTPSPSVPVAPQKTLVGKNKKEEKNDKPAATSDKVAANENASGKDVAPTSKKGNPNNIVTGKQPADDLNKTGEANNTSVSNDPVAAIKGTGEKKKTSEDKQKHSHDRHSLAADIPLASGQRNGKKANQDQGNKKLDNAVPNSDPGVADKNSSSKSATNSGGLQQTQIGKVEAGKPAPQTANAKPAGAVLAAIPVSAKSKPAPVALPGNLPTNTTGIEEQLDPPVLADLVPLAKPEPEKKKVETTNKASADSAITAAPATDTTKDDGPNDVMKLVLGIKGGFERGMGAHTANKLVISPYLQYRLSEKLSLMVQPAIKGSSLRKHNIENPNSYFDVNPGSGSYSLLSQELLVIDPNQEYWIRKYIYTETHDSIVKSNTLGGTYLELELPLLLQYNLTRKLSVYGGLNTVFGSKLGVKEETVIVRGIAASGNVATILPVTAPEVLPTTTGITYASDPLSAYTGPAYPTDRGSLFRMGYMLGVSYELKKRWMADVLLQQCFTKQNMQGGYNVNNAMSAPYVRLTIGYRISK